MLYMALGITLVPTRTLRPMRARALGILLLLAAASVPLRAQTSPVAGASDSAAKARARAAPRRLDVTPEMLRTAFATPAARVLLERARAARLAQDSALTSYKAKSYQRLTVRLGVRRLERVLMRTENVADVRWARGAGAWIEPTGRRAAAPMFGADGIHMDMAAITPIPYFPGREALWTPSSYVKVAQAEVNEEDLLHPLATGAEAYYRYAAGDSMTFSLPDGQPVNLRELRITARRPDWRAFVGSFWFDADRGHLVRAAYRLATGIDLWAMMDEEAKREAERAVQDAEAKVSTGGIRIGPALVNPLRADISAITVEYGLHEGRFWLPRRNIAEGFVQVGFLRNSIVLEERFDYDAVNADVGVAAIPAPADVGLAATDTGTRVTISMGPDVASRRPRDTSAAAVRAWEDSIVRHHEARAERHREEAEKARAAGDTAQARIQTEDMNDALEIARRITARRAACAAGDTHVASVGTRYGGALRTAIAMPCDTMRLARSADLPGTIFDPGEEVYSSSDHEDLLAALDFGLQSEWGPQPPRFHTGLDMLRFNRIEGVSPGASMTWPLGLGYSVDAQARIGTGDWTPNGELALTRTAGRRQLRVGVFHRLGIANDDWGAPLSFGASLVNALYARDEGFYYRTYGAELSGTGDAPLMLLGGALQWRLFAERQRSAGSDPNVDGSLAHLLGNPHVADNIDATDLTALGGGVEMARIFGADPRGFRLVTRVRTEGAFTDRDDALGATGYGRFVLDGTLSRGLGGFSGAISGAAGTSAGDLPIQRAFYVGGLHTVRGQYAKPFGEGPRVGDAFWLGRGELARGIAGARLIGFYDIGWAGSRRDFTSTGRPMSGAGVGVSLMDGLLRADVSRGIWPEKRWRLDFQLGSRF